MEPEEFVEEILVKTMKVQELFVGADFRFGKGRRGNAALLEQLSKKHGFLFKAVDKRMYKGAEVSSSRIRECILNGEMEDANSMLGMPYYISGEIIHGRSLGHKIGVPTTNQRIPEGKILPKPGVYCARVMVEDKVYNGISNVGCKPTVQEEKIFGVETHLYNCNENLYGKVAKTELLSFLRPEKKFSSIEELQCQLELDIQTGKSFFGE